MKKAFCVYEHVFPNGKRYIGITSNAEKRWKNGEGYRTQGKIAKAIKHYGWDNVKHNVILDDLDKDQAIIIEKYLISALDTIENGYNTAIGGDNINTTYLNDHILYMIRESKTLDEIYGQEQIEGDIVSVFERGKYDAKLAELLNSIDSVIETAFSDYKKIKGNAVYDGRLERCEAYWYYADQLLSRAIDGKKFEKNEIQDYISFRAHMILGCNDEER